MYRIVRNVFLSAVPSLVLAVSCGNRQDTATEALAVRTVKAASHIEDRNSEYPFISKPFRTSELSFRVGGPVERLDVFPGNHYRKGQTIAEIDQRDFLIDRQRKEAVYRNAESEFARIEKLYLKDNVSASVYEKSKADCIAAEAAWKQACNALEDTHLKAPFNGYVGEVFIEKYQDVKPSQRVLTLIDIDRLKIEIYVTQDVALAVRERDRAEITFDALPGETFTADIVEVSKGTGRNNLSYTVTALLPNPDGELLAGMSGKARLNIGDGKAKGVEIPLQALCHRPQVGDFVWVMEEGESIVRMCKVAGTQMLPEGKVLVSEGLSEWDAVVVTGMRFLSDGMSVDVVRESAGNN